MDIKKTKLSLISTVDNISTIDVAKNKTLRELLQAQLDNMSEEDANLEVFDAFMILETVQGGLAHITFTPISIYGCVGMLEATKMDILEGLYNYEE